MRCATRRPRCATRDNDPVTSTSTPAELLGRELRRDPARPLLTWYDDAAGARVELSVATTANWVAKVANLLVDEFDVEPAVEVGVRLPAHWQTAVVLLAVWAAGGCADVGGDGSVVIGTGDDVGADIALSLDPMGADLSRVAAAQPDVFAPVAPIDPSALALRLDGREWSHASLAQAALDAAGHHGLDASCRVLSAVGYDTADGLDVGLLMPLAAGGSVVLVTNANPVALPDRCAVERVTHSAGVTVPGVARLV